MTLSNWKTCSLLSLVLVSSLSCTPKANLPSAEVTISTPESSTLLHKTSQQREITASQAINPAPAQPLSSSQPAENEASLIAQQAPDPNSLPEIIDGMEVGMPYAEARALIDQNIWAPKTYPPVTSVSTTVQTMRDLGYEEVQDCAGTGLGLCRMEFIEREGLILVIIVTTSEAEPMVWSWFLE